MDGLGELRRKLAATLVSEGAPSARNLLVTIFGDAIAPHGTEIAVSVASLAAMVAPFGANERLVRTSLSRLVADEILAVHPNGRRSFYAIDPRAVPEFEDASQQIYRDRTEPWDGRWTIVIIDGLDNTAEHRADLRADLVGAGMSVVAPNVLMSALVTPDDIGAIVADTEVDRLLVTRSEVIGFGNPNTDRGVAVEVYPIRAWAADFQDFVDQFGPYDTAAAASLPPDQSFKLRILILASFRRIVVGSVGLPAELLPSPWVGHIARSLVATIYGRLVERSEEFLAETIETIDGGWPELSIPLANRFRHADDDRAVSDVKVDVEGG